MPRITSRWPVAGAWVGCLLIAAAEAWGHRHSINPDGVAYLDLADLWRRGDWSAANSSYWSPLYSWLLAGAQSLVTPSPGFELTLVHGVNLLIYAACLASFTFFLMGVVALASEREVDHSTRFEVLPFVISYLVFVWSSTRLIGLELLAPDLLVATCLLLAAGMLARIRLGRLGTGAWFLLGLVLGLAYTAKAAMFPIALVTLVTAFFAARRDRAVKGVAVATVAFAFVSAPFLMTLSKREGRLTFGESGRLNYAWNVNRIDYPYWRGGPPGSGQPEHPVHLLARGPAIYEFGEPVRGSIPLWDDPAYWYRGVRPRIDWSDQLAALSREVREYMAVKPAVLLLASLALAAWLGRAARRPVVLRDQISVALPALATIVLYLPVDVRDRYIGGSVAIIAVTLLAGTKLPLSRGRRWAMATLLGGAAAALLAATIAPAIKSAVGDRSEPGSRHRGERTCDFRSAGVKRGGRVVVAGPLKGLRGGAASQRAVWVRSVGARVVADVTDPPALWRSEPARRKRVYRRLAATGAAALVSEEQPPARISSGWCQVGDLHVLPLR